jgi:hypothetical protein
MLGDQGEILETTVYNPGLIEYGAASLKLPEKAFNILKAYLTNSSFNPPEAKECIANWKGFFKLTITKVSLQYYSNDYSGYLLPVYVFEGQVQLSANNLNLEKFAGSVDALDRSKP